MRNFINQIGAAIYGFFSAFYRRLTQPQPAQEVFLGMSTPLIIPIIPTINIDNIIWLERQRMINEAARDLNYRPQLFLQPVNQEPFWLTDIIRDPRLFRQNSTQWDERWFRQEHTRPRQQSEAELAVWWRNCRRQRRDEQFSASVTVLDEELYAAKLEHYPDLEVDADFICGISQEIMTNPVYDPAFPQQKYDLLVIELWLHGHETNPCTRTSLLTENLVYDDALKLRIDRFMKEASQIKIQPH